MISWHVIGLAVLQTWACLMNRHTWAWCMFLSAGFFMLKSMVKILSILLCLFDFLTMATPMDIADAPASLAVPHRTRPYEQVCAPLGQADLIMMFPEHQRTQWYHVTPAVFKFEKEGSTWYLVAKFRNGWEEKTLTNVNYWWFCLVWS